MAERNVGTDKKIDRRSMLKILSAAGWLALISSVGCRPAERSELAAGVEGALPRINSLEELKKAKGGEVDYVVSPRKIESIWENNPKLHEMFRVEAWRLLGRDMSCFASNYYDIEQNGEEFDEYYERFVNHMMATCDRYGVDFRMFVAFQDYTAMAVSNLMYRQIKDVKISTAQAVVGSWARDSGEPEKMLDNMIATGRVEVPPLLPDEIEEYLNELVHEYGLDYQDALRMFSTNITTGMMDFELSEKAEAMTIGVSDEERNELEGKYPDLMARARLVQDKWNEVGKLRQDLREFVEGEGGLIDKHGYLFDDFFDEKKSQAAFAEIGVGAEMDAWQKVNYTSVSKYLHDKRYIGENAKVAKKVRGDFAIESYSDQIRARRRLVREQINNPKFRKYLRNKMTSMDSRQRGDISKYIDELDKKVTKLEESKKSLRIAHLDMLGAEGQYEYDSEYQIMSTVLLTRKILHEVEEVFGKCDTGSIDNLAFYTYAMGSIREMPESRDISLLMGPYARDASVDTPYAKDALHIVKKMVKMLHDATGVDPKQNYEALNIYADHYPFDIHPATMRLVNDYAEMLPWLTSGINKLIYGDNRLA